MWIIFAADLIWVIRLWKRLLVKISAQWASASLSYGPKHLRLLLTRYKETGSPKKTSVLAKLSNQLIRTKLLQLKINYVNNMIQTYNSSQYYEKSWYFLRSHLVSITLSEHPQTSKLIAQRGWGCLSWNFHQRPLSWSYLLY